MRVGLGLDRRALDPGRTLLLGGVTVPGHRGAAGSDDGDLAARAVLGAVLGAAGLDDGSVDPTAPGSDGGNPGTGRSGTDSMEALSAAVRRVEGENYQVVNVDLSLEGGSFDLAACREAIRRALADRLHVAPRQVSLKRQPAPSAGARRPGDGTLDLVTAIAVVTVDRIRDLDTVHATLRSSG